MYIYNKYIVHRKVNDDFIIEKKRKKSNSLLQTIHKSIIFLIHFERKNKHATEEEAIVPVSTHTSGIVEAGAE